MYELLTRQTLILLLFWIAIFSSSGVYGQQKVPVGFELQSNGTLAAADSILPEYFYNYALGGQYRAGLMISPSNYGSLALLIPVPVLTGMSISQNQSFEMFKRAVVFQATGKDIVDPSNQTASNILLPNWIKNYISDDEKMTELFKAQLSCGNTIIVDSEVFVPLMLQNEFASPKNEIDSYYKCLYGWAAAYPWHYFKLPNVALRQALSQKNISIISLFAANRFYLDQESFSVLLESKIIPKISL